MGTIELNWLAIVAAGVVNMVVGAVWYSPMLFGKIWMQEIGMKDGEKMGGSEMGKSYGITFLGALVMSVVVSAVIHYSGALTVTDGIMMGLWLWVGFALTLPLNDVVFGKKTWKLYFLNAMYYFVVLIINGAILASWR